MSFSIKAIRFLGSIIAKLFHPKFKNTIKKTKSVFYGGFYSSSFKSCGVNFHAEYPIHLIGENYIEVGNNCSFFSGTRIEIFDKDTNQEFQPKLTIGNNVNIINDCHIGCVNQVSIGDNVLIASRVFVTDHFHGSIDTDSIKVSPSDRPIFSKGPVIIESDVWIGEGVAIMPNVRIGKNSIVGANAVVTKSFPPNSIIGGIPAKLLRSL